tara:strand:- start:15522 stop:16238 length:717 start_codon:yes stop_codon:yes gene_type:complete
MREESDRQLANMGWLHRLTDAVEPRRPVQIGQRTAKEFGPMAAQYARNLVPERLVAFADGLGVPPDALLQLGVGWTGRCFAFPMFDRDRRCCGIRLRDGRTGEKFAERDSREGVFATPELAEGLILVTEGPTDTAAGIGSGYSTIGRPSCCGGTKHVAKLTHGRDVVVVADADEAGRRGAQSLASTILPTVASVRIIEPPEGIKDLRAWCQAGATKKDIDAVIASVEPRRLKVRFTHV